jgi:transposase InsO family protein
VPRSRRPNRPPTALDRGTVEAIVRLRKELVAAQPNKRPRASYIRLAAELPNECWQSAFTHYRLADGTDIEVLTFLDDHSRCALSVIAYARVTGPIVVAAFRDAIAVHGTPASVLSDNGTVYTTRFSGGRAAATRSRPNCAGLA